MPLTKTQKEILRCTLERCEQFVNHCLENDKVSIKTKLPVRFSHAFKEYISKDLLPMIDKSSAIVKKSK